MWQWNPQLLPLLRTEQTAFLYCKICRGDKHIQISYINSIGEIRSHDKYHSYAKSSQTGHCLINHNPWDAAIHQILCPCIYITSLMSHDWCINRWRVTSFENIASGALPQRLITSFQSIYFEIIFSKLIHHFFYSPSVYIPWQYFFHRIIILL